MRVHRHAVLADSLLEKSLHRSIRRIQTGRHAKDDQLPRTFGDGEFLDFDSEVRPRAVVDAATPHVQVVSASTVDRRETSLETRSATPNTTTPPWAFAKQTAYSTATVMSSLGLFHGLKSSHCVSRSSATYRVEPIEQRENLGVRRDAHPFTLRRPRLVDALGRLPGFDLVQRQAEVPCDSSCTKPSK